MKNIIIIICLVTNYLALPLFGKNGSLPVEISRIDEEIKIDGILNESVWNTMETLPMEMFQPVFKGEPTNPSEVFVGYDDNYLYLAGKFYYNDISKLSMNTFKRDGFSNSDVFNIIIDTFNDNENAMYFMTSASGLRRDALISNDGEGDWMNLSWNTHWDTESTVTEEGWFTEVRIPFSSLRFQDENGTVTMGILLHRYTVKLHERVTFPAVSPDITLEPFKPSMAQDIRLEGIVSKKPVYITPYMLSGIGKSYSLNSTGDLYQENTTNDFDGGVDVKYNLATNTTLDITVNTDFAQAEADNQQVNLTRFNLFFPEKRQFFQERSNIFNFSTGGSSRLFHSRRIGLNDEGQSVRILGGARIVGRVGEWDFGMLNMQTDKTDFGSGENFGVLRLRKRVINPYSYVGGMVTNRLGKNGAYNTALGLDGTIKINDADYIVYNVASSLENDQTNSISDNTRLRARWERRRVRGLSYVTDFVHSGANYNPGMGFVARRDITNISQIIGYGWTPSESSTLRNYKLTSYISETYSNAHSDTEEFYASGSMSFEHKSGIHYYIDGSFTRENIFNGYYLESGRNEVNVPAGEYDFSNIGFGFGLGEGAKIAPTVHANVGTLYDGSYYTGGVHANFYLSKYLNFNTTYHFNKINFDNRDQKYLSHLLSVSAEFTLNTKLSVNSLVQYNNISDKFLTNLRLRYNFSEGNDLYLVYNETINTETGYRVPNLPRYDSRTALLKFTRTFIK